VLEEVETPAGPTKDIILNGVPVSITHSMRLRKITLAIYYIAFGTTNHRLRIRDYRFQNSLKLTNFTKFLKFVKIHKSFRVRATLRTITPQKYISMLTSCRVKVLLILKNEGARSGMEVCSCFRRKDKGSPKVQYF